MRIVPSDAIVLFDGRDLSEWRSARGGAAPWQVRDGFVEVLPGSGDIETARKFGDVQLHIEWATPAEVRGDGQGRGNRLVHDAVELLGATANQRRAAYRVHADRLPIKLQDHGNPTKFRNIWVREIE